jgi:thaumarchaeosortase
MLKDTQKTKNYVNILGRLLPLLSFIIPLGILYYLYPNSFEATWKGRTYYLFFMWLACLEAILGWEGLEINKIGKLKSLRTAVFIIAIVLPTVYMYAANFLGLNTAIVSWARLYTKESWGADLMPLCIEYLVFATLFITINTLMYGKKGLANFSISSSLLIAIGTIYLIDNVYPYGQFTPFQIFVPTTAQLAGNLLSSMGYKTQYIAPGASNMPALYVSNSKGFAVFNIAWPCSGVESLIIYTLVILLFLKKSIIPWWQKLIYYTIGAIVTYFINILRIVTIFVIAVNNGMQSPQVQQFHDYYGQLYSITWIIAYPLIIIGSRLLWGRIKNRMRTGKDERTSFSTPSQPQLSPQDTV